jgi:hypothetical protein
VRSWSLPVPEVNSGRTSNEWLFGWFGSLVRLNIPHERVAFRNSALCSTLPKCREKRARCKRHRSGLCCSLYFLDDTGWQLSVVFPGRLDPSRFLKPGNAMMRSSNINDCRFYTIRRCMKGLALQTARGRRAGRKKRHEIRFFKLLERQYH